MRTYTKRTHAIFIRPGDVVHTDRVDYEVDHIVPGFNEEMRVFERGAFHGIAVRKHAMVTITRPMKEACPCGCDERKVTGEWA